MLTGNGPRPKPDPNERPESKGIPLSKKKTATLGAGVLSAALVGGVMFAPAAAAQTEDSAFGISASGLLEIAPTPSVQGEGSETVAGTEVPGLAEATVLNAEASPNYAYADVANLSVVPGGGSGLPELPGGTPLLAATGTISATCDNGALDSKITTLTIAGNEVPIDNLEPNTTVVPEALEGIAQVTLNKQTENTVTAVEVKVLEGAPGGLGELAGQTVEIASATCTEKADDEQPPPDEEQPPPDNGGGDGGDNGGDDEGDNGDGGGDEAGPDGAAPAPTPQPGHLDVTG